MSNPHKPSVHITKVQDLIMQSPLLHWSEKLLYYSIKSLVGERKGGTDGEFEASKEKLANMMGLSIRTIQRLLKKWRKSGYLDVKEANRFKPVKYAFCEEKLIASVMAFDPVTERHGSLSESGQKSNAVGQYVNEVSHADVLVGLHVVKVGLPVDLERNVSQNNADYEQEWRTAEKDEIVMEMGRKMNEISTDISGQFSVDEKWLRFLTREEYNRLLKISVDLKGRSAP